MVWHRWVVECSQCGKPMQFLEVYFTTKEVLIAQVVCIGCSRISYQSVSLLEMTAKCLAQEQQAPLLSLPSSETIQ